MTTINGTSVNDHLFGTTSDDTINGLDGNDVIYGDAGNDTLSGGNGDDFLEGGVGNDKLNGGSGFNYATYIVATAGVTVSLSLSGAQNTGGAGTDTLTGIQGLVGSDFNDVLTGDTNANILDGGKGLDALHGGGGNDVLQESRISTAPLTGTFDGGDGYDILNQEGDVGGATLIGIEEIDSEFLGMTAAQTVGIEKLTAQHIVFATGGTIDLRGVTFVSNPGFPITVALSAAASLDLSGTLGGAAFSVQGTAGNDTIHGGDNGNIIVGGGGTDMLTGGAGIDKIDTLGGDGDTAASTVDGGGGDDILKGGYAADTISGGDGNDHIADEAGSGLLSGGDGNDIILPGYDAIVVHGDGGDDQITLVGGATGTVLDGDTGNDVVKFTTDGAMTVLGGDGADEIDVINDVGTSTIDGGTGDDVIALDGSAVRHISGTSISGGDGYDKLELAGDADFTGVTLDGHIEEIDAGGTITAAPGEFAGVKSLICSSLTLTGPGILDFSHVTNIPGTVILSGDGETFRLGASSPATIVVTFGSSDIVVGGAGADGIQIKGPAGNAHGGDGDDLLTGGTGNDKLFGDGGNDTITAGDGNNNISGGDGNDTITTGSGNDKIAGDAGNDTITSGDGNDTITGGDGDDIISAGSGFDTNTVDGGAGDDFIYMTSGTMKGGDGIDTLYIGGSRDISHQSLSGFEILAGPGETTAVLTMRPSQLEGIVQIAECTVQFTVGGTVTLGDGFKVYGNQIFFNFADANTTFTGSATAATNANYSISAGAGNDHITGGAEADMIAGWGGNDVLDGGAGNDAIFGGLGRDTVSGGAGDDIVGLDPGTVQAKESYNGGDGRDTILAGNVDLSLATVTGYEVLNASEATAVLSLTAAQAQQFVEIDAHFGIALTTGGTVDLSAGLLNVPTIHLSDFATTLLLPLDTRSTGTGFAVTGGLHNDTIAGGSTVKANTYLGMGGNDTLSFTGTATGKLDGGDGNDDLSGANGNDKIFGGTGKDVIHVSAGSDTVDGNGGIDTLSFDTYQPGVTVNLSAHTFTDGAITVAFSNIENLTGGAQADVLTGDDGANLLSGGAGNDVLTGGAGIDTYSGGANRDTFVFAGSDLAGSIGTDTAERILDFSHADGDQMDLSGLDAITGGADDPFAFIGTAAFDHHAGELRYKFSGATTLVMGDVNGDGVADFYIKLTGNIALAAGDFVF